MIALALAITFQFNFEGGSLGRVEKAAEAHYRCAIAGEADQDKRNRQANWYYFRVDGAAGRPLTLDLIDLVGEYNYRPGSHAVTAQTRPVISYDDKSWRHLTDREVSWNQDDPQQPYLRLRFTPERSPVWIAHVPPYTNRHLAALLQGLPVTPAGKTAGGRDMPLVTLGTGPKVAWLMFRQHSWEAGSSWAAEGAIRFLRSPESAAIRNAVTFHIFPMADPDGVARGGVRFNRFGFDLNRNWDAVDPATMPEIAGQRKAILDWVDSGKPVDFFLSLHNTESAEYLEGAPGALGPRLFSILRDTTSFHPSRSFSVMEATTTAGRKGRMTVAQGLFAERKIPAYLMEQRVEFNEKLGRYPTVEDRLRFGRELVGAIAAALTGGR